jgi:hypothetical protein
VAQTVPEAVSLWPVGYAFRSPLIERMGDEHTLPLSLQNG